MSNLEKIKAIKKKVKNGKLKIEHKDIKAQVLKDVKETSKEREEICRKAREKAHTVVADTKRDMSNEIRKHSLTLSEGYDFIEESYGSGQPEFTFYEEPQTSANITEAFGEDTKYGMIGVAEGVFAPIGVMSRNNRRYDDDHYDYLLENQMLVDKIASRGMLGTIGHHDKKVDDQDLAEGKVSHIVTDLHIQEEADGTRNLVGRLEILNTPAGNLLKTYYDSGMPLYVSSRGAGRLLNVANESYKRVDKTNYYLETFDIVRDPGFLGAKPKYLKESIEEPVKEDLDNNIIGENNMENKKVIPAIDTKMEAEEIINKLLNPLQEQLAELTETVKLLSEKVLDETAEEAVAEEAVQESKEEVSEEVVDEEKKAEEAEKLEADAEEDEAKAEKLKKDAKEDEEEIEEAKAEEVSEECACVEPKKETEDDEAEKAIGDPLKEEAEVVEEVKAEEVSEEVEPKKETEENEDEKAIKEEAEVVEEEVSEECEDKKEAEEKAEDEEKCDEAKEELKADEKEDKAEAKKLEADAEEDKEDAEEIKEEHDCDCKDKEEHEKECKKHHEEEHEECDEAKEEVVDYKSKFEQSEAVMDDLVKMVSEASERSKALVEQYEKAMKELNAYKLSEELSITIDEAKEKLETKSYEEIKEEAKVEPVAEEVSEKCEEKAEEEKAEEKEEIKEEVSESKKPVKPVFSRFSALNESKKSSRKGFSIFG